MSVVDFDRLKRLQLPDQGGLSLMSKVYIFFIFIACILLIKRYKDIRRSATPSETF